MNYSSIKLDRRAERLAYWLTQILTNTAHILCSKTGVSLIAGRYTDMDVNDVPSNVVNFSRGVVESFQPPAPSEETRLSRAAQEIVTNGINYELRYNYDISHVYCVIQVFNPSSGGEMVVLYLYCIAWTIKINRDSYSTPTFLCIGLKMWTTH